MLRLRKLNPRSAMLLSTLAATGSVFALVIWIKLRVVTHVPRTAYADPQDNPPAPRGPGASPAPRDEAVTAGAAGEFDPQ